MFRSRSIGRGGVTLVEMMIALIITLMIVFAMVEAFRRIGETTTDGRATIEMLGQIRHCRVLMEEDISRCTIPVEMRDPRALSPDQYHGYFELIEGIGSDSDPGGYYVRTGVGLTYNTFNFADAANFLAAESRTLFGDLTDILCMTIRNDDNPFRGRFAVGPGVDGQWGTNDDVINVIESNLAEVIWWAELNDQSQDGVWNPGETFTIHRRVLLIRPDLAIPTPTMTVPAFHRNNDVSVHHHFDATTHTYMGLQANSLGDLTFRWNRTAHDPIDFSLTDGGMPANPLGLSSGGFLSPIDPAQLPAYVSASMRGEDVVLSNVLGFDFRVWDPNVPVCAYTPATGELPEGLVPGDPGYEAALLAGNVAGAGAFVDLGAVDPTVSAANANMYAAMTAISNPHFVGGMQARSYLPFGNYVYDPWTLRYETDTYNQDGLLDMDAVVDEGGETSPPYPFPLKLLQVRIRMYESDTRQVKQVSQNIQFAK